jgi:hypothetical protein
VFIAVNLLIQFLKSSTTVRFDFLGGLRGLGELSGCMGYETHTPRGCQGFVKFRGVMREVDQKEIDSAKWGVA